MKANAVPEKIWVHELSAKELNVPLKEYHIEYTRTDAFIEKTYNWLKNYAFVDDEQKVHLPTLLHDFIKDSRNF